MRHMHQRQPTISMQPPHPLIPQPSSHIHFPPGRLALPSNGCFHPLPPARPRHTAIGRADTQDG
ncbi:uncharacterized protein BJ212DRAFT_1414103 [Suillus subaureus]|uniref:Uncharacterized protein n=1 Tax=Suillus subaureus TaxID=48587 RepID=A0A9P7DHR9_9AGAM|nr:uncharacterized protein BJ212DRAFT_1414103 [Suillus subaureus]KAG1794008.1 hypothetical protein BJ212DRAFT_1414103 [Suillus subaureus]